MCFFSAQQESKLLIKHALFENTDDPDQAFMAQPDHGLQCLQSTSPLTC